MNAQILVFVICVEANIYLRLHNLHENDKCPFFSVINIFTFVNGNCAENNYTTQDLTKSFTLNLISYSNSTLL